MPEREKRSCGVDYVQDILVSPRGSFMTSPRAVPVSSLSNGCRRENTVGRMKRYRRRPASLLCLRIDVPL
jgi:hypothetical protein